MVPMDSEDGVDDFECGAIMSAQDERARRVARLLKQGFRQFRIAGGSAGFVVRYNARHRTAVLARTIKRKKNKKTGKLLKKPRIEHIEQTVSFDKLVPLV